MAKKRGKAKRRSRRKTGVSVLGVAETIMLLNVATQAAFNTGVWTFLTSKAEPNSHVITLGELINPKGRFFNNPKLPGSEDGASFYIMKNLKENWVAAAGKMIVIPIGFRFGKQLAKPAISRANRLLTKGKIAQTVKI